MLNAHFQHWEIVDPKDLKASTADAVLLILVVVFITTVLSVFSSRLLELDKRASCSTSLCRLITGPDKADVGTPAGGRWAPKRIS